MESETVLEEPWRWSENTDQKIESLTTGSSQKKHVSNSDIHMLLPQTSLS